MKMKKQFTAITAATLSMSPAPQPLPLLQRKAQLLKLLPLKAQLLRLQRKAQQQPHPEAARNQPGTAAI